MPVLISREEAIQQAREAVVAGRDAPPMEEGISSDLGGCLLVGPDFYYVELVDGHLSGLLLDGWVNSRWLANETGVINTYTIQASAMRYSNGQLTETTARQIPETLTRKTIMAVLELAPRARISSLLEFIVAEDGRVVFVDEKLYPFNVQPLGIFEHAGGGNVVYSSEQTPTACYTGDFRPSNLHDLDKIEVPIRGRALLAHFITRGLYAGTIVRIYRE